MFALGSLLYEIISGKQPLENVGDDDVQRRYTVGEFPDVSLMPLGNVILHCWGQEKQVRRDDLC
jgi:hypothetical protein